MNNKYLPDSLSPADKKKQMRSIQNKTDRPALQSSTPRRSTYVVKFEKKYGFPITNIEQISKRIIKKEGINQILQKGMGAYFSSGSRPNVSKEQWAYARLASVIMNGKARQVDINIWNKYKV